MNTRRHHSICLPVFIAQANPDVRGQRGIGIAGRVLDLRRIWKVLLAQSQKGLCFLQIHHQRSQVSIIPRDCHPRLPFLVNALSHSNKNHGHYLGSLILLTCCHSATNSYMRDHFAVFPNSAPSLPPALSQPSIWTHGNSGMDGFYWLRNALSTAKHFLPVQLSHPSSAFYL